MLLHTGAARGQNEDTRALAEGYIKAAQGKHKETNEDTRALAEGYIKAAQGKHEDKIRTQGPWLRAIQIQRKKKKKKKKKKRGYQEMLFKQSNNTVT